MVVGWFNFLCVCIMVDDIGRAIVLHGSVNRDFRSRAVIVESPSWDVHPPGEV